MLEMMSLSGGALVTVLPMLDYISAVSEACSTNSTSFTGSALPTPGENKWTILCFLSFDYNIGGVPGEALSVTVGGESASKLASARCSSGEYMAISMWAIKTAQSSADIVVTTSDMTDANMGMVIYGLEVSGSTINVLDAGAHIDIPGGDVTVTSSVDDVVLAAAITQNQISGVSLTSNPGIISKDVEFDIRSNEFITTGVISDTDGSTYTISSNEAYIILAITIANEGDV